MRNMKHKSKKFISVCLLGSICALPLFCLTSCDKAAESSLPLTPALECLAEECIMAKSALRGENINFDSSDFARALNLKSIESITICDIPKIGSGNLKIGDTLLNAGQTLNASSISRMTFVPSREITHSEFSFTVNNLPYELKCSLYILDKENHAPTLSTAPKPALQVSTYQNVVYFGTLPCYDHDGDDTFVEIVSYPKRGLLILDSKEAGSYRYIPYEDSTGKDSFLYVARDIYGNYSPAKEVSLTVSRQRSADRYVDLENSPYHSAALTVTEKGIMNGTAVGTSLYFYPEKELTRGEFTVLAMNAAGIKAVSPTLATPFGDDSQIPSEIRGYVSAACKLGFIDTSVSKKFDSNRAITRAEAADILARMLDAEITNEKYVFEDSKDIPVWAEDSLQCAYSLGIIYDTDNSISPLSAVTRGEGARMLATFMALK